MQIMQREHAISKFLSNKKLKKNTGIILSRRWKSIETWAHGVSSFISRHTTPRPKHDPRLASRTARTCGGSYRSSLLELHLIWRRVVRLSTSPLDNFGSMHARTCQHQQSTARRNMCVRDIDRTMAYQSTQLNNGGSSSEGLRLVLCLCNECELSPIKTT